MAPILALARAFALALALPIRGQASGELPTTFPTVLKSVTYSGRSYTGTIPTEWGLVTKLTYIDISLNELTGPLPTELGCLTALSIFFAVNGNDLTSTVPSEIGMWTVLGANLLLQNNIFTRQLPSQIGQMTSLVSNFRFSTNALTGALPTELGSLASFETGMYALGNNLTAASLPTELGRLTGFQSAFYFNKIELTGTVPSEFGHLSRMRWFFGFYGNSLSGNVPTQLGSMTSMVTGMFLTTNRFTGSIPTELGELIKMTSDLSLESNALTSTFPTQLARLTKMRDQFRYGNNNVTGTLPTQYGLLTGMTKRFKFDNALFTGQLPTQIGKLSRIGLQMSFGSNYFSGQLPTQLGRLTGISINFALENNAFTGPIPTQLGNCVEMSDSLLVNRNSFSSIPTEIGKLSAMTDRLSLESNQIGGQLPSEIGNLKYLFRSLQLQSAGFTGALPTEIGRLALISSELRLAHNEFSSQVPTELGSMTALTAEFCIDHNEFSGAAPTQLGRLTALTNTFYIAHNELTSTLPTQLGFSSLYDGLAIHHNGFTGSLPSELGGLYRLTSGYEINANEFCDDLPTEVAALSYGTSNWNVTRGNHFGTECCEIQPDLYTCSPTVSPTLSPTPFCGLGEYFDSSTTGCVACPAGTYRNTTTLPAECTTCPVGKYRTYSSDPDDAHHCISCASGRVSSSDFSSCETCDAGQYVMNSSSCENCATGKYAAAAVDDNCYTCPEGFYTGKRIKATSCNGCEAGQYAPARSINCTDCAAGYYSASRAETCTICSAGTYTSTAGGASSCTECGVGQYQPSNASTSCIDCAAGKYQDTTGQASCTDCLEGYFSDEDRATSCDKCTSEFGAGFTSKEGSSSCLLCLADYVRHNGECTDCPSGARCEGVGTTTDNLQIKAGHWRDNNATLDVFTCPHGKLSCKGGNVSTGLCREGSKGPYCDVCDVDWFRPDDDSKCTQCPENVTSFWSTSNIFAKIILALMLLGIFVQVCRKLCRYLCRRGQGTEQPVDEESGSQGSSGQTNAFSLVRSSVNASMRKMSAFIDSLDEKFGEMVVAAQQFSGAIKKLRTQYKIIIQTMQIMGSWQGSFTAVSFPSIYESSVTRVGNLVSLDLMTLFSSVDCRIGTRKNVYFTRLVASTLGPIIVSALLGIAFFVAGKELEGPKRHAARNSIATTFFFFSFCILSLSSTVVFQFFQADTALESSTGDCYLTVDYTTRCDTYKYDLMCGYAAIMLFVFPIGIPLMYYTVLHRNLDKIDPCLPDGSKPRDVGSPGFDAIVEMRAEDESVAKFAFLFDSYEPQYWWFEVYESCRRLAMSSATVLLWPGTIRQVVITLFLSLGSVKVFSFTSPYLEDADDFLAEVSQWMLVCTLVWLLCVHDGDVFPESVVPVGLIFFSSITFFIGLRDTAIEFLPFLTPAHEALMGCSFYRAPVHCLCAVGAACSRLFAKICCRNTEKTDGVLDGEKADGGVELLQLNKLDEPSKEDDRLAGTTALASWLGGVLAGDAAMREELRPVLEAILDKARSEAPPGKVDSVSTADFFQEPHGPETSETLEEKKTTELMPLQAVTVPVLCEPTGHEPPFTLRSGSSRKLLRPLPDLPPLSGTQHPASSASTAVAPPPAPSMRRLPDDRAVLTSQQEQAQI